jgi:hypothetical protein
MPAYKVVQIHRWAEYREHSQACRSWAFRGQENADWSLVSSLTRYLRDFRIHPDVWLKQETRINRIFRRKAHLFLDHVPEENDHLQWQALMQHHGAPTRLLDFTWSAYVAAFFALERAIQDAAVWALNPPLIVNQLQERTALADPIANEMTGQWINQHYEEYFEARKLPFLMIGEPHVMNRRLVAQSGTFAIPGTIDRTFDEIVSDYPQPENTLIKFVFETAAVRDEAMSELYQMNITNFTLFPGIDGLARSLSYELEYNWAFDPHNLQTYGEYALD